ncbi:Putative calmodulin-like protein 2 [Apostasia shenzhenica]|uniref:Calmodulin-like protein 2 n=1 Tax=Apostasia shenzhenica TaxID=1088818 RepID=A0A2I0AVK6_9ASPA|nr:Putative calmodulin-like protein 2 [Apostasia shenzhenica]
MGDDGTSEYEKHRIARISENKARIEALGLPHLASAVLGTSSQKVRSLEKRKGKRRVGADDDEDEEYRPSDDDVGDEELEDCDGGSSSDHEEEEEDARPSACSGRKKRDSSSTAKAKESSYARKNLYQSDILDDEATLKEAIALSLGVTTDDHVGVLKKISRSSSANLVDACAQGKRGRAKSQEFAGKKKNKKLNKTRIQLTEDEVVAYFFSFDEAGKGYITPSDLRRIVIAHDFSWTETEIAHMIYSFDSDGDGKLSLEDFQNIVSRCNMMKGSQE